MRTSPFFVLVTIAEMAEAYEPSEAIFKAAMRALSMTSSEFFHCLIRTSADIDGAKPLGIPVAWINRHSDILSVWEPRPDYEFSTLNRYEKF